MIGRLSGIIVEKKAPDLLLDVNGVGYEVSAPMTTFYHLPAEGEAVTLHTHFVVREDAQLLYGFFHLYDRALFRLLIKINGVGPKLALAIMSGIESQAFVQCISDGDSATLVKVPGVGKKTAERLVIEMRDRLKELSTRVDDGGPPEMINLHNIKTRHSAKDDAESALIALGYKSAEASRAIALVAKDELSSEEMIRLALRNMA